MSRIDELFERFVTRISGRTATLLAVGFYPGVGLVLPLVLGWSTLNLVASNLLGVSLGGLIALGGLFGQVQAGHRRRLLDWTTDIRHLNSEEFEWLVGELFRREGWDVSETGRQDRPDGNIDLKLTRGREHVFVQCKRWTSWEVGVDVVRAFAGTLMRERLDGRQGILVTLSNFNEPARREAKSIEITLIDGPDLYGRIEKIRRTEPCPLCGQSMHLDRSPRGWWFHCVAEGCKGKRDLGRDPGRAVELLTQET